MRQLTSLLVAACAGACMAAGVTLPHEYPDTAEDAVSLYASAREAYHPDTAPADDSYLSPADYAGKAVEVRGKLVGRIAIHNRGTADNLVLFRMKLDSGQRLSATSPTTVKDLQNGQRVHAILSVPQKPSAECRFRLKAVIAEHDMPRSARQGASDDSAAGRKKNSANDSGPRNADGVTDLVGLQGNRRRPNSADTTTTAPALRPFSRKSGQMPRAGKQGTWDPADKAVYPEIDRDTLAVWTKWIRQQNSTLAEWQADWIARWVIYYSRINGVDHRLIFSMIKCESNFDPHAVSHAGAIGLTQLMPHVFKTYNVSNRWNVQQQLRAGIKYFARMLNSWDGCENYRQFALGAASYNAGINAVKRCNAVPNIAETRRYVQKMGDLFYSLVKKGYP